MTAGGGGAGGLRCAYQYKPPAITTAAHATQSSAMPNRDSNWVGFEGFFGAGTWPGCGAAFWAAAGGMDRATDPGASVTLESAVASRGAPVCITEGVELVRRAAKSCASSSPVW